MKYVVDRIESNIVILEEINTKEKIEININELPKEIEEGKVISKIENDYLIDEEEKLTREAQISQRFKNLLK